MHKSQQRLPFLAFVFLNDDSSRCGDTYTETVTEPTCEQDGYTTYTCSCGYSYTDNVVPALGHDYVLAGQEGTTLAYACTRCGHSYTVIAPVDPNPPSTEYSLRRSTVSVTTEHHEYVYASGTLLRETITTTDEEGNVTTETLDFVYDLAGSPYALNYTNGTAATQTYYYITNIQGDVTHLVTADGTVVATYDYDAWGKVTAATGTMAEVNPLRYRGYYADGESGFYYVSSRYYDPAVCRFINADEAALIGVNGDFVSLNLFAYCGNSPVACIDCNGNFWNFVLSAVIGVASQYVGDVIGNIAAGKTGAEIFKPTSSVGEYIAAGVTALIPGSGFTGAIIRNVVSEGIIWAENELTGNGDQNNIGVSIANILMGSVVDTGTEWISNKVDSMIRSTIAPNYSTYAGKAYKKNPNLTKKEIYTMMRRSDNLKRTACVVATSAIDFAAGILF